MIKVLDQTQGLLEPYFMQYVSSIVYLLVAITNRKTDADQVIKKVFIL